MNAVAGSRLKRAAEILSVVFHPIFIPLYGLIIIYSANTLHSFLPLQLKRMIFILVMANNVLLPMALATVLYARGAINTFNARDRNERVLLLTFSLVMYSLTAFLLFRMQVPGLFRAFFIAIAVVTLITLLITVLYRISLHASGIGGLLVLVLFMAGLYHISMVWQAVAVLLAGSAVLSSRIYLGDHSPSEVWSGFFAGAVIMGLSLFLILK
ncbi:MAG: hypothetical protein RB288_11405 [Bacteroidales bacterium]|jgi:hypothetical protein|nr:hypothetical protein [Bacteroidales bacterium]